jgi:hypothetical protein
MNRISTLFCLIVIVLAPFTANAQTTYVNNGTSTNYNLVYGDSLFINSGTYTGEIQAFNSGANITVAAGAIFKPAKFSNARGRLTIHGTAKFANDFTPSAGFTIFNYGVLTVIEELDLNGSTQTWVNNYGASMTFDEKLTLNNNASILNDGIIINKDNLTLNASSSFTNNNSLTIDGNFTMNSNAHFNNGGKLQTTGNLTLNGSGTLTNSCRLVADGSITNNMPGLFNNGLLWSTSRNGASSITNNGTIINGPDAKIKSVNFTNYGILKGAGHLYFTGTTIGGGTIGVTGITTDTLKVYDLSRTNPATIFDLQYGTVRPNTVFRVIPAPDTTGNYSTCAIEYIASPLPVKWHSFYVNLSDNTPVLNWEADHDPGTIFEIERSYNGTDFTTIAMVMSAENNKTNYSQQDQQVNTQATVVYYRIRATEPTGISKLSETRVIRFGNKPGISFQTAPNPFTSQFSINYQSTTRETLTVKVYNMSGQLQVNKATMVSIGFNSIAVTEAATLARGIYMIQVSNGASVIASQKIIKQ